MARIAIPAQRQWRFAKVAPAPHRAVCICEQMPQFTAVDPQTTLVRDWSVFSQSLADCLGALQRRALLSKGALRPRRVCLP